MWHDESVARSRTSNENVPLRHGTVDERELLTAERTNGLSVLSAIIVVDSAREGETVGTCYYRQRGAKLLAPQCFLFGAGSGAAARA